MSFHALSIIFLCPCWHLCGKTLFGHNLNIPAHTYFSVQGECYFLWFLLHVVRGLCSFDDLKSLTVSTELYKLLEWALKRWSAESGSDVLYTYWVPPWWRWYPAMLYISTRNKNRTKPLQFGRKQGTTFILAPPKITKIGPNHFNVVLFFYL